MKREERKLWYELRRTVTADTLSVEIPVTFSHEGRQGLHELLTIEKHMHGAGIVYNDFFHTDCVLYIRGERPEQENADVNDVIVTLPRENYDVCGNRRTRPETKPAAPAGKKTAGGKFEKDRERVCELLKKDAESGLTAAERFELLHIYRVAYHDGGKIEGIFSFDASAHGCDFCKAMRAAAQLQTDIICGLCYDWRQEEYRHNVRDRHGLNLMIVKSVLFTVDEWKTVPAGEIIRINSSGDIDNLTQARNMVRVALAHPAAYVGFWSKNDVIMTKAFDAEGGRPRNCIYIQSSPRINVRVNRGRYANYTFTVYDADHIDAAIAAGSMECNGKKCNACGFACYFGLWPEGSDIAELLRK